MTGGSRRAGASDRRGPSSAGADVVVLGAQLETAERVAEVMQRASGRNTLGIAADVTRPEDVEDMMAQVVNKLGRIDILVNNAGVNIRGPIEELSEEDWDTVVDTNLKGPWLCCRAVAPVMKAQKWGRVINISSMLGEISLPGRTPVRVEQGRADAPHQDAGSGMGQGRHQCERPLPRARLPPRSTRLF